MDDERRRVPAGAVGELYVAGNQVAKGYLNLKEKTEETFLNNQFSRDKNYDTLYCTGDIVRLLDDGTLAIIGRRDNQVKIRGNRVELLEVESVIREMDIIKDVTVQITNLNNNNELIAYVVSDTDEEQLKELVCDYVSANKPNYMIPSFVMKLDHIPLNINGKIDKHALPEVDFDLLHANYVGPRNEKEKEIVEAFEKAFNLDKISINDDFRRLGGDSLTAIKILSYLNTDNVTIADILNYRTPKEIAKNIEDISFDLNMYSLESGCPLNGSQLNVFGDIIVHNKKSYNIPGIISISKEYCLEDILDTLDKLLNAHPVLSMRMSNDFETNYKWANNLDLIKDVLNVSKKMGINEIGNIIKSNARDVKGLYNKTGIAIRLLKGEYPYLVKGPKPPILLESKFDKDILINFVSKPFDIYNNMSKYMVMESEESYYLIYVIHHIIFDATSIRVFEQDFNTLLNGGSVDYDDTFLKASAFAQQIMNTEKFTEAREYYDSYLSDINQMGHLPGDNSSKGYRFTYYDLEFDKSAFKSFLNNAGISKNILFASVFSYTLSKFTESDEVLFIINESGRDRFSRNAIGYTSNPMPVLMDCKDQSVSSFIENVSKRFYGAMQYSYYPLKFLYQRYNFKTDILFQFIPDWISTEIEDIPEIDTMELINKFVSSYNDFFTEFCVQIEQNGEDYKLIFMNSNKYSSKMIEDFKEIFEFILSNIINEDLSANLSGILKDN